MNAEVRQIRTAAEQGLAEQFAHAKHALPGGGAIAALRESAFETFERQGLPHRRVEEWKYTDLRAAMREARPLATPQAARSHAADAGQWLAAANARRLVIVDGVFAAELSDLAGLEKGLSIEPLARALAAGKADIVNPLSSALSMRSDPALMLNTAFMGDGVVIHVEAGAQIERPIHLVYIAGERAAAMFTRSVAVIGSRARIALIEEHRGPDGVEYQVNHALALAAGEEASVERIKVVHEGDKALHLATLLCAVGGRSSISDFSFTIGGGVVRNQIAMRFEGEEVSARIGGASLLRGKQHADNTLVIDHAVPRCTSREVFKAVVDEEARTVFQGKIIVRPGAQKTDGKMAAHALLLSEAAEANAKPELEIFADDVVCGHGATAGALDDELLFYLRARGIPRREAEALMIQAFIGEAVETLDNEALREALMGEVAGWLGKRT